MLTAVLLLSFAALVQGQAQCSYSDDSITARWQVVNGELTVEFTNKKVGNNQWTAIAWGPGMFIPANALENGEPSYHEIPPVSIKKCPAECKKKLF
ncbi:hypothetical protein WR25_15989 [Diploscapter pachys]|uniref:DOMON domain-containing protein n=1 Tax=Diploscapter pachys TaxID=2018661 RepID=A0A2A2M1I5_9BILA|nr:hypothetical protein WR25_15989 [Diploscapter pachys]